MTFVTPENIELFLEKIMVVIHIAGVGFLLLGAGYHHFDIRKGIHFFITGLILYSGYWLVKMDVTTPQIILCAAGLIITAISVACSYWFKAGEPTPMVVLGLAITNIGFYGMITLMLSGVQ